MAFYIWVDAENKELHREEKGRGRVKKNAVQRGDGNWYIVGQPDEVEAEKGEGVSPEASGEAVEGAEKAPEHDNVTKEKKTIQKTTVSKLLKSLHPLRIEKNTEETIIKIISPIVISGNDIDEVIVYNSAYAKIEIDTVARSISIWTVTEKDKEGRELKPDIIINNVIEDEKEEAVLPDGLVRAGNQSEERKIALSGPEIEVSGEINQEIVNV